MLRYHRRVSPRACALVIALVIVAAAGAARAERLPIRIYTTADGLADGRVFRAIVDARGFLWFATKDGLSRFDGHRFETFGVADGLPDPYCLDVIETRDGVVWVATLHGLGRLDPATRAIRPRFAAIHLGRDERDDVALDLFEDRGGQLWLGTEGGLWRVDPRGAAEPVALRGGRPPEVYAMVDDHHGTLWIGTSDGLMRRLRDGTVDHARFSPIGVTDERTMSLALDRGGRLWVGAVTQGVVALVPPAPGTPLLAAGDSLLDAGGRGAPGHDDRGVRLPSRPGEIVRYTPADGFPTTSLRRAIYEDSHGTLWFSGEHQVRFDGHRFEPLGVAQGFPEPSLAPLVEDPAGNLWFGGVSAGAIRLAPGGLVGFDTADGLIAKQVTGLCGDASGALYVTTYHGGHVPHRFDGDRFVPVVPALPAGTVGAWGTNQIGFPDRDGRWWIATQVGLAHYPPIARLEELAIVAPQFFRIEHGLPGRDIYRLFEASSGDVWISTLSPRGLARWDRATDRIVAMTDPALPAALVNGFAEDRRGGLWIGYDDGQLAQLSGGRVRVLGAADGLPGAIQAVMFDRLDRLWIATSDGVVRLDDPGGAHPRVTRYGRSTGLSSDQTATLVEDDRGRIYVGTGRGIDRIDPSRGSVGHLTTADGLPNDDIVSSYRDRAGRLWFGTQGGLARLVPDDPVEPPPPPPAYLTAVRAGGTSRPVAMGGDRAMPTITLAHDEGQLDLAFTSPSFAVGTPVQFEYRLDGADRGWSLASRSREVHYAHLAPGRYRFSVRAVFEGGRASEPATIAIVVRSPLWQRPWMIALVAAALGLFGWWLYRRRVAQLVAVERVRTRIATDLHDDLGSSLSRIAILSEVAARRARSDGDVGEVVGDIGKNARDLVDVAADIVWSTDPKRDDLGSLLVRLRSFAGDVLEGRGIAWSLAAPPEPGRIKLGPDERRHLYLVVKEAIHNAARHSDAKHVTVSVALRGGWLEAIVQDDGRGVDAARAGGGNGLTNMRARAAAARGTLSIEDAPGGGTRVALRVPLRA